MNGEKYDNRKRNAENAGYLLGISTGQIVDKALLLQGFAIVGTAFLI